MPVSAKAARRLSIGKVELVVVMRLKFLCEAMSTKLDPDSQDWGARTLRPNRHGERA